MALTIPTKWTVLKPFSIGDKSFDNGDVLTTEELVSIPKLSAMLSAGYLVPEMDPFNRKTSVPAHIPTVMPVAALSVTPVEAVEPEPEVEAEKPAKPVAASKPKPKSAK